MRANRSDRENERPMIRWRSFSRSDLFTRSACVAGRPVEPAALPV